MFTAKTRDLVVGDVISVPQQGVFRILVAPTPGGPRGRWVFHALEISTDEVMEHHVQPDFDWELVNT